MGHKTYAVYKMTNQIFQRKGLFSKEKKTTEFLPYITYSTAFVRQLASLLQVAAQQRKKIKIVLKLGNFRNFCFAALDR